MLFLALDVTVKALLLVSLGLAASLLLRRASSATRHLVWTATAAGLLALPLLALSLPRWSYPLPASLRLLAPAAPEPAPAAPPSAAARASGATVAPVLAPSAARGSETVVAPAAAPVVVPASGASRISTAAAPTAPVAPRRSAIGLPLTLAWLLGVVGVLSGVVASVLRVGWLERRAEPVADPVLAAAAERMAERLGLRRRVRLLISRDAVMPMTWGVRRPTVLLPRGVKRWPPERLEAVLLHELAHVRRRDHLSQYVAEAACALHWFNPAAWLVAHRLRVEREHACDDAALLAGSRASTYAAQLLDVARSLKPESATSLAAMGMARSSQLTGRLLAVLEEGRSRKRPGARRSAAALLAGAAIVFGLAAATPAGVAESPAPRARSARFDDASSGRSAAAPSPTASTVATVSAPSPQGTSLCATDHDSSVSINGDDERQHIRLKTRECDVEVWLRGVRLRDDLRGVASIAPGGSLRVDATVGGTRRTLEVSPGTAGLEYAYTLDRRKHAFDADAQRWLGSLLLTLVRESGFGADQRIATLLRQGGPDAVLDEAAQIRSDYVMALYMKKLLVRTTLGEAQMRRLAEQAADDIDSDYELAEVLIAVSRAHPVDASLRPAFLRAAGTIQSDYEHARVLKAVLAGASLTPDDAAALIASARSIRSDYEHAELLVATASRNRLSGRAREAYLASLSDIRSDYERGRALKALLAQGDVAAAEQPAVIDAIANIGSDYERAEGLIAAIPRLDLSRAATQDAFVRAAAGIRSDHEHARVLMTLVDGNDLEPEPLGMVLVSARSIQSDYELAELLVRVASKYRLTGPLRGAFLETLKGISPGYEHDRVAAALLDGESG